MIQILDPYYSTLKPTQPKYNALTVFSLESARIAFNYGNCDFVYIINEEDNTYRRCESLQECEDFINI